MLFFTLNQKKMLEDNSMMPFGMHRKKKMANVPDGYLKWFYQENKFDFHGGLCVGNQKEVMEYIENSFTEQDLI